MIIASDFELKNKSRIFLTSKTKSVENLHTRVVVSINARLMEAGAPVPYLAACVWDQVRLGITLESG